MTRRLSPIALCVVISLAITTAVAFGDPAGNTTLDETIKKGSGPYAELEEGPGEGYKVRRLTAKPRKTRTDTRRTITFFGQFTDPQLADEMSPGRLEAVDRLISSAQRPWEAMGGQIFDQTVRNMNANRKSPVKQGNGKRAKVKFAITTGDLADSQQLNETRWVVQILEGGTVDPFSGKPVTSEQCPSAEQADIDRMNADVAARRYTGIQDYGDWPGRPADRYDDFWDPEQAPPGAGSPFADFPRHLGLMERAQQPFKAAGLKMPWFTARGNHDGLLQGTVIANGLLRAIVVGCQKVFPSEELDPEKYDNLEDLFADIGNPEVVAALLAGAEFVPPDPDRRNIPPKEYKAEHAGGDNSHGYGFVKKSENKKSNGSAAYYAFTRDGIRFIALDSVAEGGGETGNIDNPQYQWLVKELAKAKKRDQLVIPYAHHTIGTMTNRNPDEDAEECVGGEAGCDYDPRKSTPLHRGDAGKKSLRALFLKNPHVIAYVTGHTHENDVIPHKKGKKRGFWEINTAAHTDWPQQARVIEVMDNGDGSLSIFGTLLDHAAPVATLAPGAQGTVFSDTQLGSLARRLAANDYQADDEGDPRGQRIDRNVELVLDDPRD
ncbi:MAG TPA: metallophosphoesterase [Thermoleophilaceae bacterium]|nr:metallophosphoesterase [Thermoleophilaceae bacterium]